MLITPKPNDFFINDTLISKSLSAADYNPTHDAMLARTLERIALKKEHGLRTPDELWIVDHNDVYTLGQAGKKEHILHHTQTPIIQTDRGGQVTWHGHGQLVLYWLFDLNSLGWSVRHLVSHAEQALEDVLNDCLNHHLSASVSTINADINLKTDANTNADANPIHACARREAPGVYLYHAYSDLAADTTATPQQQPDTTIMLGKIASLGFKIKHGFSYHGLALNIDCDLSAFNAINPCGYAGMQMLRLADFVPMSKTHHAPLSYEHITQKLIDNIAKRHAGHLALRPISSLT